MTDDDGKTIDHEPTPQIRTNEIWKRGLFMLLFAFAFGIGEGLLILLAFVQFLWLLFAKEPNQNLNRFGTSLSIWFADTARFLSCESDQKPFPWRSWPNGS